MMNGCASQDQGANPAQSRWWLGPSHRLVQQNLREIDGALDPDRYVEELQRFHATVALLNVGGIVAHYPTDLDFHFRNPFLRSDLVATVLERCHAAGIRVIGRFDFSKINQAVATAHPEWLFRSPRGETVSYNGQVHTCPCSRYQQDKSIEILDEALTRYELDGVFFNMIGFVSWDYSGVYHGICHCEECRSLYRRETGLDLPSKETLRDPSFLPYDAFRRRTVDGLFEKINRFVKSKRPSIAVSTYTDGGVDIRFHESNSDLDRPLPEFNYSAGDHVKWVTGSYRDKRCNNAAMHFVALSCRHLGVPPALTGIRLQQNLIHGGWLAYVVVGLVHEQDDRACLPRVRALYEFHRRRHDIVGATRSAARVCMVRPTLSGNLGSITEYHGLFRMLSALHIPFDVIDDSRLGARDLPRPPEEFHTLVLPDARCLPDRACKALDEFAQSGSIIATGFPGGYSELGELVCRDGAFSWTGVETMAPPVSLPKGSYLRITPADRSVLATDSLSDRDLVYCIGDLGRCVPLQHATPLFRVIDTVMFGPPEKCYFPQETLAPAGFLSPSTRGFHAYLPWNIGLLYEQRSHPAHLAIVEALLRRADTSPPRLEVHGSPLVEISHRIEESGAGEWIGFVNHTGQLGTAFHDPVPVAGMSLVLRPEKPVQRVHALVSGGDLPFSRNGDGAVCFQAPAVTDMEIVRVEYQG